MIESRGTPDGSCRLGTTQKQLDELHIVCTAKEEESSMLSSPRRKAGAFLCNMVPDFAREAAICCAA